MERKKRALSAFLMQPHDPDVVTAVNRKHTVKQSQVQSQLHYNLSYILPQVGPNKQNKTKIMLYIRKIKSLTH